MARVERMVLSLYECLGAAKDNVITEEEQPRHPFPVLSYGDAMLNYGTDKPDMRIPEIVSS